MEFHVGDLAESKDLGVVMVVDTYPGCYGREMVNAVRCDTDDDAAWLSPLAYFADELRKVTE